MNEHENLKEGQLITLNSRESMLDLLYQSCVNGLNCLCLLDSLTKEYLVQKLLLMHNQNGLTGSLITDIVLKLLSYVAERERMNIKTRQSEGIASAKQRGVKFGRPKAEIPKDFLRAYELYTNSLSFIRRRSKAYECTITTAI